MTDKLLYVDENIVRSSFLIKAENVLVKDNRFQEGGIMENIAQTAALRAGYLAVAEKKEVVNGYIGAIKDFEVFELPKSGDEIFTEVKIENQIFNVTVLSGKVWLNNVLIASCEMKVFMEDA